MKYVKSAVFVLSGLLASIASAETAQEMAVKKLIEPQVEGTKVDSVTKMPFLGLFEVRLGTEIIYTDKDAKYLIIGRIIDAKTHQDFTKARLDDILKIKFSDLPLDSAVKMVRGDGKRVIAIFEDPNCGYCKKLRHTLQGMDNLTVYTFMYNILSEDSTAKSKNIWCSADRNKAWDDWMADGKIPAAAPANCVTPNEKVFELGQKLKITGTPAIFFTDGSRIPGAVDSKGLEAKLATMK